jgi:hypothetical protein
MNRNIATIDIKNRVLTKDFSSSPASRKTCRMPRTVISAGRPADRVNQRQSELALAAEHPRA